ncbi:unnamed protein product [Ceratitis capitata]|uniref:(Mediterranean fruit fly) hypothetical protein n=1 Tax=Ceratitis capitata TaxID=7213 RepID=A0A811VGP0_CERCA|nr:unnamed protein product [Ceratitis capitata]
MSSIPLLHRSSLSLLPLQCCNCNNFLAHILLLISSLLSTLSGNNRAIKRILHNKKTCLYDQRHHTNNSSTCNSNHKNSFCSSQLKSIIPEFFIGLTDFYLANSVLSKGSTKRIVRLSTYRGIQTSDTYTLTSLKTSDLVVTNKYSGRGNTNWEVSKRNFASSAAQGRRFFDCPQPEDQKTLQETGEYCCFADNNNNNCRKRYTRNVDSVLCNNIHSVCSSPRSKLFVQFDTNTCTRQRNITTVRVVVKPRVTAAVIKSVSVDLTHPFLQNTFTPDNNCENSSTTSQHLNNIKKPFSISSVQKLSSRSLTSLLQEKEESTHSNKKYRLIVEVTRFCATTKVNVTIAKASSFASRRDNLRLI